MNSLCPKNLVEKIDSMFPKYSIERIVGGFRNSSDPDAYMLQAIDSLILSIPVTSETVSEEIWDTWIIRWWTCEVTGCVMLSVVPNVEVGSNYEKPEMRNFLIVLEPIPE